uniref:7TM_GPCR_Srx domain-containing protein n=1 Tax=Steinernema glaseri TaxID=37863 RepID=A0A1I7ZT75_9BILA
MTAIGAAQCTLMAITSFNGVMLLCNTHFSYFLDKFLMAVLEGAFIASVLLLLVLAINRFYIFYAIRWIQMGTAKVIFNILVGLSWLVGLFFTVILLTPGNDLRFSLQDYGNVFDPATTVVSTLVLLVSTSALGVAFFFYMATVLVIVQRRFTVKAPASSRIMSGEIRLFVQGVVDFLFAIAMEVFFYFAPPTRAAMIAIEVAFILYNGYLNPVAYVIINRTIERPVERLCKIKECQFTRGLRIETAWGKIY